MKEEKIVKNFNSSWLPGEQRLTVWEPLHYRI